MKELRGGESSTATRPPPGSHIPTQEKLMRDQENRLQHLVSSRVPSPPYPGIAILTPSVLFGMDPHSAMLSAHILANIAATNPNARYQFPIPISLGVQAPGSQVFNQHHGTSATGGNVPRSNPNASPGIPNNAGLDILSNWIQQDNPGKKVQQQQERKLSSCNVKSAPKKHRESNWSKSNKSRKGGMTATENVINSRKTAQLKNNESDIDIKHHTIIPRDDHETGYQKGGGGGRVKKERNGQEEETEEEEEEELMTQHKTHNNNNNITTTNNNNNNHNSIPPHHHQSNQQFRDKIFTCPICSRCFGYKHVLQNHERTHTGEKPFECNICHKKFTRDHHLKTHMRLHTGEKPYKCTHCDRQFVQVANLRRHLRVHTGERPYACDLCSSRFSDSNQLKAHMLIHKGEKPYSCKECGGRFRRRHHLVHHKCNKDLNSKLSPEPTLQSPLHHHFESSDDISPTNTIKRERKPRETRRIIRLTGLPVATVTNASSPMHHDGYIAVGPEQTVPEDLSLGGSALRHRRYSGSHSSCSASPSPPSGESHGSLDAYCRSITSSDPPENSSDDEQL